MNDVQALPLDRETQLATAQQWAATQVQRRPSAAVRSVVRDSWSRALDLGIRSDLKRAPLVWEAGELECAREAADWLDLASRVVAAQRGVYTTGGHVVTLFDASGRMLHSEGDAGALEQLKEINFRPGALWSEAAVGTNGPGTALATRQPVHVVGAEHFCEQWQRWHCAAVPVFDPLTHDAIGAIDLSGLRDGAHPHTLMLVMAMGVAVEQMLAAREMERRARVLARFAACASRWPGEALVAIDRAGSVLSSSAAPAALHPLATVPEGLRRVLAELVRSSRSEDARQDALQWPGIDHVIVHPVFERSEPIGACLLVTRSGQRRCQPAARVRGSTRYDLDDLVGDSPALLEARRIAIAAAANTLPVLLLGESGTGKEVFAQGIHAASERAAQPFIAVNCAALPAELVESELFGYVGGAFSGARRDGGIGKFEAANGGTIFLDEVGELPLAAQASLLRVLQEGEITRVGATRSLPVDVRVIAATNRDIDSALGGGSFRDDLYYRLGVLVIRLPSLRERRCDVERLARRFLEEAGAELGRGGHEFAAATLDALRAYHWPGNIRELKNLVWRTVALVPQACISPDDLPAAIRNAYAPGRLVSPAEVRDEARPGSSTGDSAWEEDRSRIMRAVERAANMSEAAAILGIARSTLYRQLDRFGLQQKRVVRG